MSGAAKAWVNFNGTSTVAIRASFNVTSITDNGTGDYTVNFTNALEDANYVTVATRSDWGNGTSAIVSPKITGVIKSTTQTNVFLFYNNSGSVAAQDDAYVQVAIFR